MDTIMHKITDLTHTVQDAAHTVTDAVQDAWDGLTQAPEAPPLTRAEAAFLEEQERARRINSGSQSRIDQDNAKNASALISKLSFPYFKGNTSQGFKRLTKKIEETERERRMAAKPESTLRRMNANKSAGIIRSLGWPFFRQAPFQGPEYIMVDPTRLAEEEEREYRLSNPAWALQARNNGALLSNLMRWEWDNAKYYSLGMKRWSRGVEEKERASRLADKHAMETAIINAYNTSAIIRGLGWPFFVQEEQKPADLTWDLEEKERKYRMSHPEEQQLAREIAGKLFEPLQDTGKLEEKERARRLADTDELRAAITHAKAVSALVSRDTARMEEEERLERLRNADRDRKNARRVAHLIDGLGLTVNGITYLEEKERKRRVNDPSWQSQAKEHGHKLSALLGDNFAAKNIDSLEEAERNDRMWNKSQQLTTMKNARSVSRIIEAGENKWSKVDNLEEQERSRRLIDRSSQILALSNARDVSNLIKDNAHPFDSSSVEEEERLRRLSDNSEQQQAKDNASKISSLISSRLPADNSSIGHAQKPLPAIPAEHSLPRTAPADFNKNDLRLSRVFPEDSPLPEPILPSNTQQETLLSQPAPFVPRENVQPIAPVAAPIAPVAAPFVAPVAAPITSYPTSTYIQPTTNYAPQPTITRTYSSPASVYATAPIQPSTSVLPATGLHLHTLNATDRKRLEKQASKENKRAQKESKRAQKSLAKAEKLHSRGKEYKAMRAEVNAEKHTVAAKHHQLWANDLTKDVYSAQQQQASPYVVGAPTM